MLKRVASLLAEANGRSAAVRKARSFILPAWIPREREPVELVMLLEVWEYDHESDTTSRSG